MKSMLSQVLIFDIVYQTKLSAVTNLQNTFNVVDKGKKFRDVALSVTGDNPVPDN